MLHNWHRVSKNEPCPICHHTDWCILSDDGMMSICQRVESDHPTKASGGWVHRLRDDVPSCCRTLAVPTGDGTRWKTASVQQQDCGPTPEDIAAYFAALPTTKENLQERMCGYLEKELGLPKATLMALDWRWDHSAKAVAIPMRNAEGVVTGIRYRALKSGAKWAKRGSRDGLFFAPHFVPGVSCLVPGADVAQSTKHQAQGTLDEIMVCEGPTDQAAAMACGFWCLGRSSCGTGRDLIRDFIREHRIQRVTIFSDLDKPKIRPDGTTWFPGQEGAERLGRELGLPYRIVYPPAQFKDLREWYRSGTLNNAALQQAVKGSAWKGPCHD